ncbi:MAG: hypothetical protein IJO61_08010 [Oscillospiraceae bacterium]|nr:hypothetical protein [Oscillospiraceae bacterium]
MKEKQFNNYDVFNSFLVCDADYDGYIELPKIRTSKLLPSSLISFSKAMAKAAMTSKALLCSMSMI